MIFGSLHSVTVIVAEQLLKYQKLQFQFAECQVQKKVQTMVFTKRFDQIKTYLYIPTSDSIT